MHLTPDGSAPFLDPDSVHRRVLGNGLTVLVRRDASAPVVAINTYVKAGYLDEPDDVAGVSHVLEHMYFKGTPTRGVGQIARETKATGGYLNAHTTYDHTSYYAVVPSSGFAEALAVQADAFANSLVDADELRRELEVIVQEARRKRDNPGAVARETLYELLHDRHRIRRWRIGTEEGLRALSRNDVVGFYRNHYRPSNTILSIAGDVSVEHAFGEVERLYGQLEPGVPEPDEGPDEGDGPGFRWRELHGDITQSQVVLGWRVPGLHHADAPLLDVAAAVLASGRASRLHRHVRERRLASSIGAVNFTPGEIGVFTIQGETRPGLMLDALRAACDSVCSLAEDGPEPLELERARRLLEAAWLRRFETMEGQAAHLAEWEAAGGYRLGQRYLERMLEAPPAAIRDVTRRWLRMDRVGVLTYRPADAPPAARDAESMRKALASRSTEPDPKARTRSATPVPAARTVPRAESVEFGVHVFRTERGVPVLVRRKPGAPIVHAGLYALGGARNEHAHNAGITKLLSRTALKGTAHRDATCLAEEMELLGGVLRSSAGSETFGWSTSVPTRHLPAALELLADIVQRPSLQQDALETELAVALAEVASLGDDMYRHPVRLALEAAFPGHPFGLPAAGLEPSLRAATPESLREWHRRQVLEGELVIGIVGDVDPADAAAVASAHFGQVEWRPSPGVAEPAWPSAPASRAESRDRAQTALALALPAPSRRDPERVAAELLTDIASGLGGRFFEELRDRRSLAYTVHLTSVPRTTAGLFLAYIGTDPAREAEAREGLLEQFRLFAEEPVTDEELQRARMYALGSHAIARQGGGYLLSEMLDAWLLGERLEELESYAERVRGTTADDIRAVASRALEGAVVEGIVRGRT